MKNYVAPQLYIFRIYMERFMATSGLKIPVKRENEEVPPEEAQTKKYNVWDEWE